MKTKLILAFAALAALFVLPSCAQMGDLFGGTVEIVQNRNADGTFKPDNEVQNSAGEFADGAFTAYHFPGNKYGVTAWRSRVLTGAPKLSKLMLP